MQLTLETDIDAPADQVWATLGTNFATIDEWSSFVRRSRPIERAEVPADLVPSPSAPVPGRETTTKATLIEVITDYSDEHRALTFHGVGLPPIVRTATNRQSVRATGDQTSTVVFEVDFDFKGPFEVLAPLMKARMRKTFGEVQNDLKRHVEAA